MSHHCSGPHAALFRGDARLDLTDGPVSMGRDSTAPQTREYRFFAGSRSDPFFSDQVAFNNIRWIGKDFGDDDVRGIVLDAPNSALGRGLTGVYARTRVTRGGGRAWVQLERGARPSQVPFLIGAHTDRLSEFPYLGTSQVFSR
ncbi:MAG TPA: hypothetical protein VGM82_24015 [Gemmatimonadaceae bacterium]|jgi:hypothetical protein